MYTIVKTGKKCGIAEDGQVFINDLTASEAIKLLADLDHGTHDSNALLERVVQITRDLAA